MVEERYGNGDNVFAFPNQHLPYFRDVADRFEEQGINFEGSEVLFVGGTLYAHDFKADRPEAEVDVIERNPLTAYIQTFIAHQFEQGYDKNEIKEQLFTYSTQVEREDISADPVHSTWTGWPELSTIDVDIEELQQHVGKHQEFSNSDWWTEDYGFAEDILHISQIEPEQPKYDLNNDTEKRMDRIDELNIHSDNHKEDVLWAHLREGVPESEPDALSLRNANTDHYNWREVLEDIDSFASVDNIMIEDVTNTSGNYDAIFFNNVVEYFDMSETQEIIDSLTDEDGAYIETTLLGSNIPNDGRAGLDDHMPENIELMESAPEVDFYWKEWPEDQKGVKESPNKVRLYEPRV